MTSEILPKFIHLRIQSSYSLLESALKIENIVKKAKNLDMPAVAITDKNNLFGLLEFSIDAKKSGVQAIHGAIVNMMHFGSAHEILIIAKNETGYKNLLKIVSNIYIEGKKDLEIGFADLALHHEGLIVLSGYAKGHIGSAILSDDIEKARAHALAMKELLGDRYYFEIMRHGLAEERSIEQIYLKLAIECDIPLVATNNVLFEDINAHYAHDVLLCIAEGVVKEQSERRRVSNQCYFKSPEEMQELFKDIPEAIDNSYYIMQRCCYMAKPSDPQLPHFADNSDAEIELLKNEAKNGLTERLKHKFIHDNIPETEHNAVTEEYFKRIEYELDIICKMNFAGYFLIVSDFIKWSKKSGIPVGPGRGSGAGSVVAWSLLITDLDPIKFGLLFERFLNPERISMPDFDIDFCQERRDEVIKYVCQKYGNNKVGQIITFGKMQAKAVIKDVSRVLGLKYNYADYLTELVPFNAVNPVTLEQAITEVAELNQASKGQGLYSMHGEEELIKEVLDTALILEGIHRHVSVHAAGIVIGSRELIDILPLYKDPDSEMLITQYSMKYSEAAGLVKFDFLGLQTLTLIDKCSRLVKENGTEIDPNNLPTYDKKTFDLLETGQSSGIFQFESVGMKDALRRLKADCIDDLIALGALYRPGPMENIPTYIACKHGKQAPDYLHPSLVNTLKETYGVIIYQEQVMEIAQILGGYSLGAADLLRRAMGKKIKAEMAAQEAMFVDGAKKNGISESQARSIFELVAKFAGYGFNKAHAAAYGVISYQTAYLKANFPAEFLTTCMNLDIHESDKVNLFIQEARYFQINVVPPDINISAGKFYLANHGNTKSIIFALGAIKGVTATLGNIIYGEAQKKPFLNIMDFIERIPSKVINKRSLENLIKAGAFDSMHPNRNELIVSIPKLIAHSNNHHNQIALQQFSLIAVDIKNLIDKVDDLPDTEKAMLEFEVCGVFLREHPLSKYTDILSSKGAVNSYQVKSELANGSHRVEIAGIIQKKDSRMSARGRFITIQLSDQFGNFEVTIFNEEILKKYVDLLEVQKMVIVSCDMFKDEGGFRLTVASLKDLEAYFTGIKHEIKLYPKDEKELDRILDFIQKKAVPSDNPNTSITIFLAHETNMAAKISLPPRSFNPGDIAELQGI
ncbi:MAG: hypothetical protein RLZZ59_714 [Pseudomonadota bacterium]|jgi:DNA polymerase-3 subunit alpha